MPGLVAPSVPTFCMLHLILYWYNITNIWSSFSVRKSVWHIIDGYSESFRNFLFLRIWYYSIWHQKEVLFSKRIPLDQTSNIVLAFLVWKSKLLMTVTNFSQCHQDNKNVVKSADWTKLLCKSSHYLMTTQAVVSCFIYGSAVQFFSS